MRAVRALTGVHRSSADQPWLPGLPHAIGALATYFVFGVQACVTGLLLATLASFVVYLPVIALALNGGRAIEADAAAPMLTTKAQVALFGLWTVTAWIGAGLASVAV